MNSVYHGLLYVVFMMYIGFVCAAQKSNNHLSRDVCTSILFTPKIFLEYRSTGTVVDFELPKDNTVSFVINERVDRWLQVEPISLLELEIYCSRMKTSANKIESNVVQIQKDKVLQAYKKLTESCLQELRSQYKQRQVDQQKKTLEAHDGVCHATRNLTVGATVATGCSVGFLSYFKYSKLAYVTSGLYASYLCWQYHEHNAYIQRYNDKIKNEHLQLEQLFKEHEKLVDKFVNNDLELKINEFFLARQYDCHRKIVCKIDEYKLQKKQKLLLQQEQLLKVLNFEKKNRQNYINIESDHYQNIIKSFIEERSELQSLEQPVVVTQSNNPVGWKEKSKSFLGAVVNMFNRS